MFHCTTKDLPHVKGRARTKPLHFGFRSRQIRNIVMDKRKDGSSVPCSRELPLFGVNPKDLQHFFLSTRNHVTYNMGARNVLSNRLIRTFRIIHIFINGRGNIRLVQLRSNKLRLVPRPNNTRPNVRRRSNFPHPSGNNVSPTTTTRRTGLRRTQGVVPPPRKDGAMSVLFFAT